MAFGYLRYQVTPYDDENEDLQSGVMYKVCTVNTPNAATIYSDEKGTSKTNPVTTTVYAVDGSIVFFTASSVTTVDIYIASTSGGFRVLKAVAPGQHKVYIDNTPGRKIVAIPIETDSGNASDSDDSGFDVPITACARDAWLHIYSCIGSGTIDVGLANASTSGDIDGFLDGVSTATSGTVYGYGYLDSGTAGSVAVWGHTLGALLWTGQSGATASNTSVLIQDPTFVESGTEQSIATYSEAGCSGLSAWLILTYDLLGMPRT